MIWNVIDTLAELNGVALQHLQDLQQTCSELTCWVGEAGTTWIPVMNIQETEDAITVTLHLPNVDPASIQLQVSEETMLVKGNCRPSVLGSNYYEMEFGQGYFYSLIPLPVPVQPQGAIAHCHHDVLTLTLPRHWRDRTWVAVQLTPEHDDAQPLSSSVVRF